MRIIRESRLRKLLKEAEGKGHDEGYDEGVNKGYELGWQMRRVERDNRGFVIGGSKLDSQIEEILKSKQ